MRSHHLLKNNPHIYKVTGCPLPTFRNGYIIGITANNDPYNLEKYLECYNKDIGFFPGCSHVIVNNNFMRVYREVIDGIYYVALVAPRIVTNDPLEKRLGMYELMIYYLQQLYTIDVDPIGDFSKEYYNWLRDGFIRNGTNLFTIWWCGKLNPKVTAQVPNYDPEQMDFGRDIFAEAFYKAALKMTPNPDDSEIKYLASFTIPSYDHVLKVYNKILSRCDIWY